MVVIVLRDGVNIMGSSQFSVVSSQFLARAPSSEPVVRSARHGMGAITGAKARRPVPVLSMDRGAHK
jgi:hypothetical protein